MPHFLSQGTRVSCERDNTNKGCSTVSECTNWAMKMLEMKMGRVLMMTAGKTVTRMVLEMLGRCRILVRCVPFVYVVEHLFKDAKACCVLLGHICLTL